MAYLHRPPPLAARIAAASPSYFDPAAGGDPPGPGPGGDDQGVPAPIRRRRGRRERTHAPYALVAPYFNPLAAPAADERPPFNTARIMQPLGGRWAAGQLFLHHTYDVEWGMPIQGKPASARRAALARAAYQAFPPRIAFEVDAAPEPASGGVRFGGRASAAASYLPAAAAGLALGGVVVAGAGGRRYGYDPSGGSDLGGSIYHASLLSDVDPRSATLVAAPGAADAGGPVGDVDPREAVLVR